jgi:cyclic lactone autoinducer peptide
MKKTLLFLAVTMLSVFAAINAAGACNILFYQPELPRALKK